MRKKLEITGKIDVSENKFYFRGEINHFILWPKYPLREPYNPLRIKGDLNDYMFSVIKN